MTTSASTFFKTRPVKFKFISVLKRALKGAAIAAAFFPSLASASPLNASLQGDFTIQQVSSGRYLDAHTSGSDHSAVTRDTQENATQVWKFTPVGVGIYTIQQKSNGRFLDAYVDRNDYSAVTRTEQGNRTQKWIVDKQPDGTYVIAQYSTFRFLDAHQGVSDNSAVTREFQDNTTQRWIINPVAANPTGPIIPELFGNFHILQKSTMRFMDAHNLGVRDESAVTREAQGNRTQIWTLKSVGNNVYTIQQLSSGRYLDAHEGVRDNSAVTRTAQGNSTQLWKLIRVSNNVYTIQQVSNGRYLDAHEAGNDFSIVTRNAQGNATQQWVLRHAN